MTDYFPLALFSLGASTAAIILALYLIARSRQPGFDPKGPGEKVEKPPVTALSVRSIGLELKKLVDKE